MTLGVYIIARNEEDLLKNCIDHILPFVDQLVLVNHGSEDATREIMHGYTSDKVSYFELVINEIRLHGNGSKEVHVCMRKV